MSEYQTSYRNIIHRVRAARRKETTYIFGTGLLYSLSITLAIATVFSYIENIANGDETFRTILASLMFFSFVGFALIFTYPAINRLMHGKYYQSREEVALRIGYSFPELKDKLCNAMQLIANLERSSGTSSTLAIAAFEEVSITAQGKNFNEIIDKRRLNRALIIFFIASMIAAGIFVSSGTMRASFDRIMHWNASFVPPAPFSLSIMPESMDLLRNDKAIIKVKAEGSAPDKISLFIKEEQQENFDSYSVTKDSLGEYSYEIASLKKSISFYAEAEWLSSKVSTKVGSIKVIERPLVKSLSGKLVLPGYTGLGARDFDEQSADLTALAGSRVKIDILSNKELDSAHIVIEKAVAAIQADDSSDVKSDTVYIPMEIDGANAKGSFTIRYSGQYYISLLDKDGRKNTEPIRYSIIAMYDDYPSISLLDPVSDVQIGEDGMLYTRVSISDDYGFSGLVLNYKLIESEYTSPFKNYRKIKAPIIGNELAVDVPYLWNLNDIGISPADKYEFYFEVFDNDRVSGPKSARTQTLTVRLPSLDEVLKDADKQQDRIDKDMKHVLKETNKLQKDMEELNRELLKKQKQKKLDWKEKKKAEEIFKKQNDISKKLKQLQNNLNDVTEKLEKNNAISPETLQKYKELQKLMKEVNSPEMKKMSEQIKNAMDKMTPKQLKDAMEKYKFNEEQLKKSIERTMKVLKRMKAEQKADALTKRAEELLKKQEELQKETQNADPKDAKKREELAKKQDKLQKDLDNLNKEMENLEDLMKEIGQDMPMQEMQEAKDALKKDETNSEMQKSENAMKQGDMNQSQQNQERAKNNIRNFAQKMQNMKKQMSKKVSKEAIRKMQKAVSDLLELSQKQEDLMKRTKGTEYNSTQFPELSRQQAELNEALANIANSMIELSQKSFAVTPEMGKQIGQAMQQMKQASRNLTDRRTHGASKNQQGAMESMNNAISNMQGMLSMMQQPGSGSCPNPGGQGQGQGQGQGMPDPNGMSFAERLQQAAALQQQVNQGMQQQMGQGGKLSREQQAEYGRLATQQGGAQKALDEIAQQHKKFNPGDKISNELEQLAKEMKEVMSEVQSGNITPSTLKRQEKILSRLLDATKSIHDRDYEKQRKSRSGKDINRISPGSIDLNSQEGKAQARRELLNSIKQGYSKDYERLIRKYFEKIQDGE